MSEILSLIVQKNNINNIYKMKLFNKISNLIPKQLYSASKHNVLALVFVLLVLLVVQYPATFSKSANTVLGKAVILLIVILLTNYNTLVGLAATIAILVLYVYLFDTGYEGYEGFTENMDTADSEPPVVEASGKSKPSKTSDNLLITPTIPTTAPTNPTIKNPSSTAKNDSQQHVVQIKEVAKNATASKPASQFPGPSKQNTSGVAPSDSAGNKKITAVALKPSVTTRQDEQ